MGKIDINPKNKGKFTATKKKTGKSTEELCHSKNPLTRKRANFAKMAKRHWKPLKESSNEPIPIRISGRETKLKDIVADNTQIVASLEGKTVWVHWKDLYDSISATRSHWFNHVKDYLFTTATQWDELDFALKNLGVKKISSNSYLSDWGNDDIDTFQNDIYDFTNVFNNNNNLKETTMLESIINKSINKSLNNFLISEGLLLKEESLNKHITNAINEFLNEERNELPGGEIEIDNFQNVRDIMKFDKSGDTLYFVEIIKRKKDNPTMNYSRSFLKQYYLKNEQEFKNAESEIKNICKSQNARAYIYLNARSKATVDKYTQIYANRFKHNKHLARHFGNNPMAFAAGRSFDAPNRPLCFVDIDSDDFNDIKAAMKIIQDAGIKPLFAYRSMNNGLHIILPNKEDAKKLDFSSINGDLSGLSQFYKNNAKISLEIDKPTLLYACLKPNGYGAQQARFQKAIQQRDKNKKHG